MSIANVGIKVATAALKNAAKSPNAAQRVSMLTKALPTGSLTVGSKQVKAVGDIVEILGSKGVEPKPVVGFLEKLLGETGSITVANTATKTGQNISFTVNEAGKTVAKTEVQASFLEKLAQVLEDMKLERITKAITTPKNASQYSGVDIVNIIKGSKMSAEEIQHVIKNFAKCPA